MASGHRCTDDYARRLIVAGSGVRVKPTSNRRSGYLADPRVIRAYSIFG